LLWNAAAADRAAAPVRADHPPSQVAKKGGIGRLTESGPGQTGENQQRDRCSQAKKQFFHVLVVISL
jgi:hypothetical protein